jgi:hypothetical protein
MNSKLKLQLLLICLLDSINQTSFANELYCAKLNERALAKGTGFYPTVETEVIGKKVYLHSAPAKQCKIKNVFVIKETYLPAYTSYQGWVNVMVDVETTGWLPLSQIKVIKQYGN